MKPVRPTEPMEAFGARIYELRRACGLTQQAVADRLQIHRTTYTKYETGRATPDQQGLVRLAEIFGVSVDCLLGHCSDNNVADIAGETVSLSAEEQALVQLFRRLNEEQRKELLNMANATLRHS